MSVLHELFSFPTGAVTTNLEASALWVVPGLVIAWRKKLCRIPWCHRIGHHPVSGTTWKVCHRHHRHEHHLELFHRHAAKHPERLGYGDSHDVRRGS